MDTEIQHGAGSSPGNDDTEVLKLPPATAQL